MARTLEEFVDDFVVPLLTGGMLSVAAPIRPRDRDLMFGQTAPLMSPRLRYARLRRARLLTAEPMLPDPELEELNLWIGLHNMLVFDHPERARVWTRAATWRRVEGVTRTFLSLPHPEGLPHALTRHLAVGAVMQVRRTDTVILTAAGEMRFAGQTVPRQRLRFAGVTAGHREETIEWFGRPHTVEAERLLEDAMRASPLTCLLAPRRAPPGWSPLLGEAFLRDRAYARAICHQWAKASDWVEIGGAVTSALMASLPIRPDREQAPADESPTRDGPLALPGVVVPTDPAAIAAVVGALVHLHFLKVLELEARLGVAAGSRDPGVQSFLAMPLLLPWLQATMGTPLGAVPGADASRLEQQIARRWGEYLDHLDELVPRPVVENLLAALVPRIVQPS